MPHKHNDINHGVDPELIRRYLAGELDDKAMHLLEKQALDDPFLAEALEGYAEHTPDQQLNLADLESRLEKRVAGGKVKKLPVYYRWAAAAAILLLAVVAVTKLSELPQKKEVAKVVVQHDSVAPAAITDEIGQHRDVLADVKREASDVHKPLSAPVVAVPIQENETAMLQRDSSAVDDERAVSQEAPVLSKLKQADMAMRDTIVNAYVTPPAPEKSEIPRALSGRVAGAAIGNSARVKKRTLTGKITDNNKNPLSAVSVVINNTNNGALTDKEGNFALRVDDTAAVQLNVNYIGYESKKLEIDNKQNNLNIAINEANNAQEEVVVVGYGSKRKRKAAYQEPLPGEGFESYQEYLVKNVRYPASAGSVKGTVKVAFTVNADGRLKNFKVIQKLHPDCDAEAIRLIKEGPAWIPASDGKSGRVQVDVPFTPEH